MSDPYERVKGGRLAFKGGTLATRSKNIDKKKKKNKKSKDKNPNSDNLEPLTFEEAEAAIAAAGGRGLEDAGGDGGDASAAGESYTIDAAKKMKYEELFPVECKKFGYQAKANFKSVEEALDDRVKKKADRYCK